MNELECFNPYNGDTEHDIWVDFDNFEYTGLPDVFDDPDLDKYIENLDDWA